MTTDLLRVLRWDAEGDARLRALSADEWDILVDDVATNFGLSLLARRLHRAGVAPPPHVGARLRVHAIGIAARTLDARTALARAIDVTGRPALLLKGVDLAARVYGNFGHRQMGDVDFLVRPEDAMAYHAHLTAQGFRTSGLPDAALMAEADHHLVYVAPGEGRLPFELHWRLSGDHHDDAVDFAGLWSRALPDAGFAEHALVMAPDDLFLYLCLHLKNHTFETPLTHVWDLAEVLTTPSFHFDWATIWQRAAAWRLTASVRIALHLVRETLGVATPQLGDWRPEPALAEMLPDPFVLLGRHSESMIFTGTRLGTALSGSSGLRQRAAALAQGVLPSRREVRARYGQQGQGAWGDVLSHLKRVAKIWPQAVRFVFVFATGRGGVRAQTARLTTLRDFLDE